VKPKTNVALAVLILTLVALALVVAACGGKATMTEAMTTAAAPTTTVAVTTTQGVTQAVTTTTQAVTATTTVAVQTTTTAAPATTTTTSASTTTTTQASTTSTTARPTTTITARPTTTAPSAPSPVIVLDPGHSGTSLTTIDPETQISDEEYPNMPEMKDVFDVAVKLKAKLEAAGFTVLMTKNAYTDTVTKRQRADLANRNNAALAVSIHTSGHVFGQYGQIYVQTLTSYRENIQGQKVYFTDAAIAALSAQYGQIFLTERRAIEGSSVVVTVNSSFEGRGLAPGNISVVQLFSTVPWIYNEAGAPQNHHDKDLYAQSLFNSIVKCVPIGGAAPPP
jgi:N-acetylmuramoyl-L-alanine amidase